jgi:hypothetical protein
MHVHAQYRYPSLVGTGMAKQAFTTRLDPQVLSLAQKVAEANRRSVTSVIEIAIIRDALRQGIYTDLSAPSYDE